MGLLADSGISLKRLEGEEEEEESGGRGGGGEEMVEVERHGGGDSGGDGGGGEEMVAVIVEKDRVGEGHAVIVVVESIGWRRRCGWSGRRQ